jgi:hypothetical protein
MINSIQIDRQDAKGAKVLISTRRLKAAGGFSAFALFPYLVLLFAFSASPRLGG